MPRVKVSDISLYYEVHGNGEALALIMGLGGGLPWLFPQVAAFDLDVDAAARRLSGQRDRLLSGAERLSLRTRGRHAANRRAGFA